MNHVDYICVTGHGTSRGGFRGRSRGRGVRGRGRGRPKSRHSGRGVSHARTDSIESHGSVDSRAMDESQVGLELRGGEALCGVMVSRRSSVSTERSESPGSTRSAERTESGTKRGRGAMRGRLSSKQRGARSRGRGRGQRSRGRGWILLQIKNGVSQGLEAASNSREGATVRGRGRGRPRGRGKGGSSASTRCITMPAGES